MGFLSWIILGLIAGALAKWLMPGKDGGGWIVTMALGTRNLFTHSINRYQRALNTLNSTI